MQPCEVSSHCYSPGGRQRNAAARMLQSIPLLSHQLLSFTIFCTSLVSSIIRDSFSTSSMPVPPFFLHSSPSSEPTLLLTILSSGTFCMSAPVLMLKTKSASSRSWTLPFSRCTLSAKSSGQSKHCESPYWREALSGRPSPLPAASRGWWTLLFSPTSSSSLLQFPLFLSPCQLTPGAV